MVVLLSICKFFMKLIYFFLKLLPTRDNQIVFLSRQSNEPSIDFQYMIDDIKKRYPEYKLVILTKRMEKNNIKQTILYPFHVLKQLKALATSTICITDGYQIAISCLKHKKVLRIYQIWHSLGAIKAFGYQTLNTKRDKAIAKVMHMHEGYKHIMSASHDMIPYFAKAFNNPEDKFKVLGLPRIDYLIETASSNQKKVYKEYPELKKKKVILYVPTFRVYDEYKVEELINACKQLRSYQLVIKKHPRMKINIDKKYSYDNCSSFEFLSIADIVITDYSAMSIEAAILNKPVMLYIYDEDKYREYEGINTNLYEDLPGYVFKDEKDLVKEIAKDDYDMNVLYNYRKKYVENTNGTCTKEMVDFIINDK